jgi:hypothetical protein
MKKEKLPCKMCRCLNKTHKEMFGCKSCELNKCKSKK